MLGGSQNKIGHKASQSLYLNESLASKVKPSNRSMIMSQASSNESQLFKNPFQNYPTHQKNTKSNTGRFV